MGVIKIKENGDALDKYLSQRLLLELKSLSDELEDIFSMFYAQYGLSLAKFNALLHLYMAGDRGLNQSELSKKLMVSKANITGLIERLEKEDLVVRGDDPSDKRAYRVCLANKAATLMNAFLPIHNNYVHKIMSSLNRQEKEIFISLIQKLINGLESI